MILVLQESSFKVLVNLMNQSRCLIEIKLNNYDFTRDFFRAIIYVLHTIELNWKNANKYYNKVIELFL